MKKLWYKIKYYYEIHDGIELVLFASIFGFTGWMAYHAILGIIGRFS
tara:strand:+ start:331 stop:471 length:141 start_codon:yes stop_codon:yes gene_type:complete